MEEKVVQALFSSDTSSGTALLTAAAKIIGEDIVEAEPETIHITLSERGIKISEAAWNKCMAAILLVRDGTVWQIPSRFVLMCNALISGVTETLPLDIATVEECALALNESRFIFPPDDISSTVQEYVRQVLIDEGYFAVPKSISKFMDITLPVPEMSEASSSILWSAQKERTMSLDRLVAERDKSIVEEVKLLGEDISMLL